MAVKTNNIYGKITITDRTVGKFVSQVALDCYGIVGLAPHNIFDAVRSFILGTERGVFVRASGDRMVVEISVVVIYGVSIKAVIEALKECVKYKTERFTGMIVDVIDVNVVGVKK